MIVYRIQKNGHGPFRGKLKCPYPNHWGYDHPGPWDDGIPQFDCKDKSWICGCLTRAQLRHWFPSRYRRRIKNVGFRVAVYEVPDRHVRVGGKQVQFKRRYAKRII